MRRIFSCIALTLAIAAPAQAQTTDRERDARGRFSVERFVPAPGAGNYLTTDGANVASDMAWSAGGTLNYAWRPFTIFTADCTDDTETNCDAQGTGELGAHTVEHSLSAHLWGSLTLMHRLQVSVILPLHFQTGEDFRYPGDPMRDDTRMPVAVASGPTGGVGDLRLHVKGRIFGDRDLYFGAALWAGFPIGHAMDGNGFLGDESVTVGGHLIGEYERRGLHVAGNIGGFYRGDSRLFSTVVGSQVTYKLAVGYDVTPLILAMVELDGATSLSSEVDENPIEVRVAGRMTQGDYHISAGVGAGVLAGVGTPAVRVIGGFAWAPSREDRDGDGISDDEDSCPDEAEDNDDWMDDDGCPEADNDGDGRPDVDDPCPDGAEDMDGFEDDDYCPDLDNDGDGVRDGFDGCPMEPEDMDGDRDDDGCPDDDSDRDGIPDGADQCPDDPEDTDGFGDEDGCPEADFDGDGMDDDADECPDEAENFNQIEDEDGCPEPDQDNDGVVDSIDRCPAEPETVNGQNDDDGCPDGQAVLEVRGDQIILLQQVRFANNSDAIRGRDSQQVIAAVATILRRNPQFRRVRIEGHTDNAGRAEANRELSQRRATAVMNAIVALGISADRLSAVGHGQDRPVADNNTREGRETNRRVEFHIEGGPSSQGAAPAADAAPTPAADAAPAPAADATE